MDKPIGFYCFLAYSKVVNPDFSDVDNERLWSSVMNSEKWRAAWCAAGEAAIAAAKNQPQIVPESQVKQPIEIDWLKLNADMSKV
jgi:hypothetical protein